MSAFVIGPGFSGSRSLGAAGVGYIVLGPIPAGVVLDAIELCVSGVGEATPEVLLVGLVVSQSDDPTDGAFASGKSLVDRSDSATLGKPALQYVMGGPVMASERIYPGFAVASGPVWVLVRCFNAAVGAVARVNVSVRTQRAAA